MTTIRRATPADRAAILAMATHFAESTDYGRLFGVSSATVAPFLDLLLVERTDGSGIVFLAVDDTDVPIGMLALIIVGQAFTDAVYADELVWWVERAHRKTMAGPLLLDAAVAWTRTRGVSVLKMVAPAQFKRLGVFYKRRGFVAVETSYTLRV